MPLGRAVPWDQIADPSRPYIKKLRKVLKLDTSKAKTILAPKNRYLLCDQAKGHCVAKVRPGGNCQGFGPGECRLLFLSLNYGALYLFTCYFYSDQDICMNGQCQGGRCVQTAV